MLAPGNEKAKGMRTGLVGGRATWDMRTGLVWREGYMGREDRAGVEGGLHGT